MGNHVLSNSFAAKACPAAAKGGLQLGRSRRKGGRLEFTSNDGFRVQMNKKPRLKQIFGAKGVTIEITKGGGNPNCAILDEKLT